MVRAHGNGSSSGNSVNAVLKNNTAQKVLVHVHTYKPLFLRNSGVGQDMITSMVLGADGGYLHDGGREVIEIKPGQLFDVSMVAYCADFEKENPIASESFVITQTPSDLVRVIEAINRYVQKNPNANVTGAAQLAIWMARGEKPAVIAEKFEFAAADETLARSFLGGP